MDRYSTSRENPASKQVTDIGVTVTKVARRKIEGLVGDAEPMIKRCVWRFIYLSDERIKGDSVELVIDARQISKLYADLRQIDLTEVKRKHRQSSRRTDGAK